jgi:hypothetical protein
MEVKIVIPSHKRPNNIQTLRLIPGASVCVPESQLDEYQKANPSTHFITHPDSVKGLTLKRQWIYENVGDVFMFDDDIMAITRLYVEPGEERNLTEYEIYELINRTAWCAKQAGAFLFGFNNRPNPTMYRAQQPIQLTGYITGCATGLLKGSKLWYNGSILCNEDYWISLLNAYYHRIIYRDNRFAVLQKDTFTSKGGLSEIRNIEAEKADFELLRKVFGDAVELKEDTKLAKRKHPYQKTMKLPF